MTNKNRPIHELRLGSIRAAIWRNETENGARFNTTFSRLFKSGDKWASTDSFGRDDLLLLGKVADEVHSWIIEHQHQDQTEEAASTEAGVS